MPLEAAVYFGTTPSDRVLLRSTPWTSVSSWVVMLAHTHSPKAGQGMNTAFHDALNMAWKLHAVESGFANRSILSTYESERKDIAETLLNFDAKYAALFSKRRPNAGEVGEASHAKVGGSAKEVNSSRPSSPLASSPVDTELPTSPTSSLGPLATPPSPLFNIPGIHLTPGRAFTPTNVTRLADSNFVELEQEVPANGSFRIFVFAGNQAKSKKAIADFAANLEKER